MKLGFDQGNGSWQNTKIQVKTSAHYENEIRVKNFVIHLDAYNYLFMIGICFKWFGI